MMLNSSVSSSRLVSRKEDKHSVDTEYEQNADSKYVFGFSFKENGILNLPIMDTDISIFSTQYFLIEGFKKLNTLINLYQENDQDFNSFQSFYVSLSDIIITLIREIREKLYLKTANSYRVNKIYYNLLINIYITNFKIMYLIWISEMQWLFLYGRENSKFSGFLRWAKLNGKLCLVFDIHNLKTITSIVEAHCSIDFKLLNYQYHNIVVEQLPIDILNDFANNISDFLVQLIYDFNREGIVYALCNLLLIDKSYDLFKKENPENKDQCKLTIMEAVKNAYLNYPVLGRMLDHVFIMIFILTPYASTYVNYSKQS